MAAIMDPGAVAVVATSALRFQALAFRHFLATGVAVNILALAVAQRDMESHSHAPNEYSLRPQ